jgi:hypothetical protein
MALLMLRRVHLICLAAAFAALAGGCTDECQQLAEQICECENTPRERESCRLQVNSVRQTQADPTDEQRDTCQAALASCTCAALERNETFRCGFTQDPGAFAQGSE